MAHLKGLRYHLRDFRWLIPDKAKHLQQPRGLDISDGKDLQKAAPDIPGGSLEDTGGREEDFLKVARQRN